MRTLHRPIVLLPFEKEDTHGLIDGADLVWTKMSGDPALFGGGTPAMSILRAHIDDFVTAHELTKTMRGAVPAREAKREILWSTLGSELAGVQRICGADPEQAGAVASAAGMRLKARRRVTVQLLKAWLTTTKGKVALRASLALLLAMLPPGKGRAGKRTIFWRYTLDKGQTFVDVEATPFVTTEIDGLPLGVDVGFQVALQDRRGRTAWSQTFTLHVY